MELLSTPFFQRIILLGICYLREISCQEFSIIHVDPTHLSSIFQNKEMMRDLSDVLSDVLLQTSPDHPSAAEHSFSINNKKDPKHYSTYVRRDFTKPAIATLPKLFPPRKGLEPKFSSLTYAFVPHSSPGHDTLQDRNFSSSRLNSEELSHHHNLKLQNIEQNNEKEPKVRNRQISALRNPPSHISNRDPYDRSTWDNRHQHYSNSKVLFHGQPHQNAERGQESIRRPTTLSQTPVIHHEKEKYPQLSSRQSGHKKLTNGTTSRRPISFVNFALKVNLTDAPVPKIKDINGPDEPILLLRNSEPRENKRYLVFRTPTVVRPSSAPFTSTGFFRNVPQSSPRDVPSSSRNTTSIRHSNDSYKLTDLQEGKAAPPYVEHPANYDVTEVYSQGNFQFPQDRGENASFHPVSSYDEKPQRKKSEAKKSKLKSKSPEAADVPGQPGTDYPTYYEIPLTNFDCKEFHLPGFYADLEAGCQVFHNCDTDLQKHSFLCPNGTLFTQELFICDWWYNVRCEDSLFIQP